MAHTQQQLYASGVGAGMGKDNAHRINAVLAAGLCSGNQ
jgi:hypothetical protein